MLHYKTLFFTSSALLFVLFWLFVPVSFEQNDDVVMMMIANGTYSGEPSANLVFINAALGAFFRALYIIAPDVAWYPGIMLFALCACMSFLLLHAHASFRAGAYWQAPLLLVISILLLNFMLQLQFTTAAGAAVAIGSWTFLSNPDRVFKMIGAALVIFGFLLRFDAGALVILVSAALYLGYVILEKPSKAKVGAFIGVLILCLVSDLLSQATYRAQDADYVAFNAFRGHINDNPNVGLIVDELPHGVTNNDYQLLISFFADPQKMDLGTISAISTTLSKYESGFGLSKWGVAIADVVSQERIIALMALIIWGAFMARASLAFIWILLSLPLVVFALSYVQLTATLKDRVVYVIFVSIFASLLFFDVKARGRVAFAGLCALCLAFVVILGSLAATRLHETITLRSDFLEVAEIASNWEGRIYLFGSAGHLEDGRLFTDDLSALSNKIVMAGWMVNHPDNHAFSSHADLLDQANAVLIDADARFDGRLARLVQALEDNYGVTVQHDVIARTGQEYLISFSAR